MSSKVAVLAHFQPLDCRPTTHVLPAIAKLLVNRLAAEKISAKLIRMLPPDSVLCATKIAPSSRPAAELMSDGSGEIPGVYFVPPKSQAHRDRRLLRWHWEQSQEALRIREDRLEDLLLQAMQA